MERRRMSDERIDMLLRYGVDGSSLYKKIEGILNKDFPQLYECFGECQHNLIIERTNIIYEKLAEAFYEDTLIKLVTRLHRERWEKLAIKYSDGNPGALTFLLDLDRQSFKYSSSEEILSMLITMGLKGSTLWIYYKDCCDCNFQTMEKVFRLWRQRRLSLREIMSHMNEFCGKKIEIELLS